MRVLSLQTRDLAQLGALELDGESITEGFSDNKKLGSIDGVLELSLSASEGMEEDFILGANEADITLDGEGLGGLDAVLLGITDNNTLGTDDRLPLGLLLGTAESVEDDFLVGDDDGNDDKCNDGPDDGETVGTIEGVLICVVDGNELGSDDGSVLGISLDVLELMMGYHWYYHLENQKV